MKKLVISLIVILLLVSPAAPVYADNGEGKVLFGEDFVLQSGEEFFGDVAVFNGDVTLEEDSMLDGDVLVMGGNAEVAGQLLGDIVVFGGDLNVESTGVIKGDAAVFGGTINEEPGSRITGQRMETRAFRFRLMPFSFRGCLLYTSPSPRD